MRTMLPMLLAAAVAAPPAPAKEKPMASVRVSQRDRRYLELSDGRPYVPIGLNMIQPPWKGDADARLAGMTQWMEKLSANGGNYIRVWLSADFWDVEHARSGEYDAAKAGRIDAMLAAARKHGIRVKMTLEHFRDFFNPHRQWVNKPIHHVSKGGPAKDVADFFDGEKPRAQFRRKLAWYAKRYGDEPIVFGWELWNEVNCVRGGDTMAWTEAMLAELGRLFPRNLAMQSLGSFDTAGKRAMYRRLSTMKGNDVAQVHRYLDLGARLEVCHGPVDVLAAEAVRELLAAKPGRPVILAESGAVEKSHSGPFKLYAKDTAGVILHDVLFAPFFAGAAGTGQIWHWDHYVAKNDLWWHFGRFAEAVKGIDPPAERFQPSMAPHDRLRVYVLTGARTTLAWCRDTRNTWKAELADGKAPEKLAGLSVTLGKDAGKLEGATLRTYDPWTHRWRPAAARAGAIPLPAFQRSLILRIDRKPD